jgi:hypothetical protein
VLQISLASMKPLYRATTEFNCSCWRSAFIWDGLLCGAADQVGLRLYRAAAAGGVSRFPGAARVRGDSLFDAVVVGAGAGGAAAAYGLCRRGLSVLLLDAGPRFDPPSDYSLTQADWDLRDFPQKPSQPSPLLPARNSATSRCWPRAAAVSDPL